MSLVTLIMLSMLSPGVKEDGFPGLAADRHPEVEIPWNRLYDYPQILSHLDSLVARWPRMFSYEVIGHSVQNRELRVYTLNNPDTGSDRDKPAMWIDGNVHGNEVQATEVVVYAAWYLLENYASSPRVRELVDRSAFYLMPSVNPDGRAHWFRNANSASSSRSGVQATDNDRDGLFDEDGSDDLDGDGHIVRMRKYMPDQGTHVQNRDDPRILERIAPGPDGRPRGDWILLGSEGIDNDGDGRINEDGLGGYDMNRAWPSSWMPEHVQYGAGPYQLYWPETRRTAEFILDHPNIAAVQSFHNAGGMILRGPGAEASGAYPAEDVRVYDSLGKDGEKMLPFYRYMVIWKDLYSVFGGFVNWTYEGLGIISFTNELWARARNSPDSRLDRGTAGRHWFDDHLLMSEGFVDWHPYDHPFYGPVEIGGFKKDVGRVPASFLMEEMLHRNALFCLHHAGAMPEIILEDPHLERQGDLITIDVTLRNIKPIPTRTKMASNNRHGRPDIITLRGNNLEVLAAGYRLDRHRPERLDLVDQAPHRLVRETGIPGRGSVQVRWIVRGSGEATIGYQGEKARNVERSLRIE